MKFQVTSFFNPHLPPGAKRVDAVITVTADPGAEGTTMAKGAIRKIAIALDESGSMGSDNKWEQAKKAASKCLSMIPDGDYVTIVTFSDRGQTVVPLTRMTAASRLDADRRLHQHRMASGGTAMSTGLDEMAKNLGSVAGGIMYGLFLTDGQNDGGDRRNLDAAIERMKSNVEVDCRGIGVDWRPDDLRTIASALLGTADAVPNPDRLEADFTACLKRALGKSTGDVSLYLWKPGSAKLVFAKQMTPEEIALSGHGIDPRTTAFPLGGWGKESRDYHVAFEIEGGEIGDEVIACRPSIVWSDGGMANQVKGAPIAVTWTEDEAMTTRINPEVAHYTGQTEIATSIRDGLEARNRGDEAGATRLLGRAAQLASASGNDEVTRRLSKVVDVVDAEAGTVRLRRDAGRADTLELEMGGTRTVRRQRS